MSDFRKELPVMQPYQTSFFDMITEAALSRSGRFGYGEVKSLLLNSCVVHGSKLSTIPANTCVHMRTPIINSLCEVRASQLAQACMRRGSSPIPASQRGWNLADVSIICSGLLQDQSTSMHFRPEEDQSIWSKRWQCSNPVGKLELENSLI